MLFWGIRIFTFYVLRSHMNWEFAHSPVHCCADIGMSAAMRLRWSGEHGGKLCGLQESSAAYRTHAALPLGKQNDCRGRKVFSANVARCLFPQSVCSCTATTERQRRPTILTTTSLMQLRAGGCDQNKLFSHILKMESSEIQNLFLNLIYMNCI